MIKKSRKIELIVSDFTDIYELDYPSLSITKVEYCEFSKRYANIYYDSYEDILQLINLKKELESYAQLNFNFYINFHNMYF